MNPWANAKPAWPGRHPLAALILVLSRAACVAARRFRPAVGRLE